MWMIRTLLDALFPPSCLGCGAEKVSICPRCVQLARKSLSVPNQYTVSVFDFRDPLIKRAIHRLKYRHRATLVEPLARELARILRVEDLHDYVLVPIPMTTFRRYARGYNHAEKIADAVSKELQLPMRTDILRRKRHTRRQAVASKEERFRNQRESFSAKKASGQRVLLIDDVTTTGATLEEARRTLLASGAKSVRAATLAH
jgi:ComF family protein